MRAPRRRPLASAALLAVIFWSNADAELRTWGINEDDRSWQSASRTTTAIDFSVPGAIQIAGFEPTDNIIQALTWVSAFPIEGYIPERPQAHIWNNYPLKESDIPLVDGDPNTSTGDRFKRFGSNQAGRRFSLDLGSRFPVNRIAFFPRLTGVDDEGIPYWEDYVRGYELYVNNGLEFGEDNQPIYQLMKRVEFSRDSIAVVEFPNQFIRYVGLRVLSKNPFEIAEIEIYGSGFVPKGEYLSKVIDLGEPTNFGILNWSAVSLRVDAATGDLVETPQADVSLSFQMRSGLDDSPEVYYEITNKFLNELTVVTEDAYKSLTADVKGGIEADQVNWSTWSEPFTVSGQAVMLPSPRRFVQFRGIMESGRISDGLRVDDLTLEIASPPLARRLFGEISLLADPAPQDGFATVPVGVPSRFAYDLLADVRDADVGIDALRITTPTRPTFVELLMGADESNLTPVVPSAVEEESDGLTLYFPENRIAAPTSLRVIFDAELLVQSTFFNAQALDTESEELPQPVLPPPRPLRPIDDPNSQVTTNKLQVLTSPDSRNDVLRIAAFGTRVITPNGDGVNDQIAIQYSLLQLLEDAPNTLEIFDLAGRRVYAFREDRGRGPHTATWDGRDAAGRLVPVGLYLLRVAVEGAVESFAETRTIGVVY